MRRLEAQVGGRRSSAVCGKDGVGELEEGISPAVEAFVERAAEGAKSIVRFHDGRIMHLPTASRTSYLPAELKRKLSPLSCRECDSIVQRPGIILFVHHIRCMC